MKFCSFFSGIEAASIAFKPLGWEALSFSEIEPFPCAVLKHHYPEVPNHGDILKYDWSQYRGKADLVCGGPPCQAFSIAGLRKGLEDPRGNLTLAFLRAVDQIQPRWVVMENVPGIVSDKTGAFKCVLDGLEELGYVVDVDILDAQFFGVPQRRRRVWIAAQKAEDILKQRTDSSALTIAQCLLEILHSILAEVKNPYITGQPKSTPARLSRDGAQRRMKLFGIDKEENWQMLRSNLADAVQRSLAGRENSALKSGESASQSIKAARLIDAWAVGGVYILTEESLLKCLDVLLPEVKLFTTSTTTPATTDQRIYMCFVGYLLIGKLICLLRGLSPCSTEVGLSFLTGIKEFTNYARKNDSELFGGMDGVLPWGNVLAEADSFIKSFGDIGDGEFAESFFSFTESLCRDLEKGGEKGEGAAACFEIGPGGNRQVGKSCTIDTKAKNGPIQNQVGMAVVECGAGKDGGAVTYDLMQVTAPINRQNRTPGDPCHTLAKGNTHSAAVVYENHGQDSRIKEVDIVPQLNAKAGTGGGNLPLVQQPIAFNWQENHCFKASQETTNPLRVQQTEAIMVPTPIAFKIRQGCEGGGKGYLGSEDKAFTVAAHQDQNVFVPNGTTTARMVVNSAVRRLTPTECERLQGFPDGYTAIPWKNKPAENCPDGPRYKALGNSWAVPCAAWVGRRIQEVDGEMKEAKCE